MLALLSWNCQPRTLIKASGIHLGHSVLDMTHAQVSA